MSYTAILITCKESPCHHCQVHTPTCHGACKDYADFRAKIEEKRRQRKLQHDVDWAVSNALKRMGGEREV